MNFQKIFDDAHAAGMAAIDAYDGHWYPCGFASVEIRPRNNKFAKWMVSEGFARSSDYGKCIYLWVHHGAQSMYAKKAYADAFAAVLLASDIGTDRISVAYSMD